jgi:hypothetical protein
MTLFRLITDESIHPAYADPSTLPATQRQALSVSDPLIEVLVASRTAESEFRCKASRLFRRSKRGLTRS